MAGDKSHKKPYALDTDAEAPAAAEETPEAAVENTLEAAAEETPETAAEPAGPEKPKKPTVHSKSSGRPARRGTAPAGSSGKRKKRKKKKKSKGAGWFVLAMLVLLLAAGAFYFFHTYLLVGTQIVRKDAETVDLRSGSITLDTYNELREKLPEAEILWNVPIGGGEYNCESDSIVLSRFSEEDLGMLSYFKHLSYIDAENADLTVEQYEALSAALPDTEIDWCVPIGGSRYPLDADTICLSSLSEADFALLDYLPELTAVDASACRDYPAILALREARPDLKVTWQVPLSGTDYADDATAILVDDPNLTIAELEEALHYLPNVTSVDAPDNAWSMEEKDALRAEWPGISFHWPVTIGGTVYDGSETALDFKGKKLTAADVDELVEFGRYLPDVTKVDLTDSGVSLQDAVRLKEVFPEAEFTYAFDLYGKHITTEDTFLDFTGVKIDSTDTLEAALPLLSKLEKVDMSDCGISDENMDALNKRHENVRFVWTMRLGRSSVIRTDDLGFIGTMDHYLQFDNNTIKKLTYCEDMLCLDLGHRVPTGLKLDFLYDMPQLQYLVLADCRATDITPIGSLKNLVYLEMILSYPSDLSPLKECTSLKDLNVCFCYDTYNQKDKNFEIFTSMADHLERLWYSSLEIDPSRYAELEKAMPNTKVQLVYDFTQATSYGWRYHERYYQMRDYLQMIYMGDYGGRQYTKIIDGKEIPIDKEFLANQRQPDWSKVRH